MGPDVLAEWVEGRLPAQKRKFRSSIPSTGRGDRIGRARAAHAEGRELNSRTSQTSDNLCLSLPGRVLCIIRIG